MSRIKDNFFYITGYFKYCMRAKDEYAVHSPLIFDFYTKAIKGNKKDIKTRIQNYFNKDIVTELYDYNEIVQKITKNGTLVIIMENIHRSLKNNSLWQKIIRMENIAFTSMDLFCLGILIKNEKLLKRQHYVLRRK